MCSGNLLPDWLAVSPLDVALRGMVGGTLAVVLQASRRCSMHSGRGSARIHGAIEIAGVAVEFYHC